MRMSTCPLKRQAAKEEHSAGEYPGGMTSAMWDDRRFEGHSHRTLVHRGANRRPA
jgi:hypothetical protein